MTTHNIFHGGEAGISTVTGPNAWGMYPRPDIVVNKTYKSGGQYSGNVTRRVCGARNVYQSDGGEDPVIRYLKQTTFAADDELAMIIIPAHYRLRSLTVQVYAQGEQQGVFEGGQTGQPVSPAAPANGVMNVILRQPASAALGLAAADVAVVSGLVVNTTRYNVYDSNSVSVGNRLVVVTFPTAPTDWNAVDFEITALLENIRDIGRPT